VGAGDLNPTVTDHAGAAKHAAELSFDERNEFLGSLSDDDRNAVLSLVPQETIAQWVQEENQAIQEQFADQPDPEDYITPQREETVELPGPEKPERESDADANMIKGLVMEKFDAEQRAIKAERERDEANAEVEAYYRRFGPLTTE